MRLVCVEVAGGLDWMTDERRPEEIFQRVDRD
jgi:hypothetical protein